MPLHDRLIAAIAWNEAVTATEAFLSAPSDAPDLVNPYELEEA